MHNFFINQPPYNRARTPLLVKIANRGLRLAKIRQQITPRLDPDVDMCSTAQRINMFHLLEGVFAYGVPGDVVELGCFAGQCAMLFQKVIELHGATKALHLYDSFEAHFGLTGDIQDALRANFHAAGLQLPTLHKGYFADTLPTQLPGTIAFAHIDCGSGGGHEVRHKALVLECLAELYPRLAPGAVCCLMDYHDETTGDRGLNANPGVKLACDVFMQDKPEQIVSLFGDQYSHGYFRKL